MKATGKTTTVNSESFSVTREDVKETSGTISVNIEAGEELALIQVRCPRTAVPQAYCSGKENSGTCWATCAFDHYGGERCKA